jgi:TorA maturation chaperone TorD
MKKIQKKLISLAVADVWTSLFNMTDNRPAFPNGGDRRTMTAEFIQLTAKEEKTFWAVYDKLQSKKAALTAQKIEKVRLLRMSNDQPEERSVLFSDLFFNWVSEVMDLYERQTAKMTKDFGRKRSIAILNIEMDFYTARVERLMTGSAFSSHEG